MICSDMSISAYKKLKIGLIKISGVNANENANIVANIGTNAIFKTIEISDIDEKLSSKIGAVSKNGAT